jgi:hypothetical protein
MGMGDYFLQNLDKIKTIMAQKYYDKYDRNGRNIWNYLIPYKKENYPTKSVKEIKLANLQIYL